MNPDYAAVVKDIRSFWSFASENIHHVKSNDLAADSKLLDQIKSRGENPKDHYLTLSVSTLIYIDLCERLEKIDPEIEAFVGTDFINFADYDISKIVDHVDKMVVVRNYLELSASGNRDKFLLLDIMKSTSDEFKFSGDWVVSIYKQRSNDYTHHMLVPMILQNKQTCVSISAIQFALKPISEFGDQVQNELDIRTDIPLNQQFDLLIVIPDSFAKQLKTQQDVYQLRNSFFIWLESVIGEYSTAMNITRLTIIPQQGLTAMIKNMQDGSVLLNSLKDGVYLIPELSKKLCMQQCELCRIQRVHTNLTQHKDDGSFAFDDFQHKHSHIREGYYCKFCFELLKKIN